MAKAGIFDPWRQTPDLAEQNPEPKTAMRIADALEVEAEESCSCVSFPGYRGQLNVWLNCAEASVQEGTSAIVDLIHLLWVKGFKQSLMTLGINVTARDGGQLRVSNGRGDAIFVDTHDAKDAVDILVFALREAQDDPAIKAYIQKSSIKALLI